MFYKILSFVLICLYCSQIETKEQRPNEAGFSGDVLLGAVYLNSQSLLNAGDENQSLNTFNDKADNDERFLPGLLGNVYYTFDSLSDQVYLGVSRSKAIEGQFSPELGYKRFLSGRSSFTLAYIPNIIKKDTYADPFVLNTARDETEQSLSVVRAKWASIANSGLGVELAYGDLAIKHEQSGEFLGLTEPEQNLLKRDASYSYIGVDMKFPIAKGIFLTPSIYGFDRNAQGKAYSHQATGVEVALFILSGRHRISANIRYAQYRYDADNPVFDQRRKDEQVSAFAGYFYQNPFDMKNTTYTIISNYRNRDSNINFYQSQGLTVATGLNWMF